MKTDLGRFLLFLPWPQPGPAGLDPFPFPQCGLASLLPSQRMHGPASPPECSDRGQPLEPNRVRVLHGKFTPFQISSKESQVGVGL
jgi:hypothetical protein